jgi:hypothetical protein
MCLFYLSDGSRFFRSSSQSGKERSVSIRHVIGFARSPFTSRSNSSQLAPDIQPNPGRTVKSSRRLSFISIRCPKPSPGSRERQTRLNSHPQDRHRASPSRFAHRLNHRALASVPDPTASSARQNELASQLSKPQWHPRGAFFFFPGRSSQSVRRASYCKRSAKTEDQLSFRLSFLRVLFATFASQTLRSLR